MIYWQRSASAIVEQSVIAQIANYQIINEIASGGMAVVYRGIQENLARPVAIKVLKPELVAHEKLVARFEREAASVASFQHENIITVYDFLKAQGSYFIVMEYVEGVDVYDLLEKVGQLPVDVAVIIAVQVARALDYAHFRGVIHRDVKPANIILSKVGEVKLTDFGVAKVEDQQDLTEAGLGVGTPSYMSPEQVIGERLDHRTDIWSIGVVLYQMVVGRKPFEGDDQRTVSNRVRLEEPVHPRKACPSISRDLERIILRCLEKNPENRYLSTQDLVNDLSQYLAVFVHENYRARLITFLQSKGLLAHDETDALLHPALIGTYSASRPRLRWPGRRQWRAWLMIGGAVIGCLALGAWWAKSWLHDENGAVLAVCPDDSAVEGVGYLRVLAHPWANIELDGKVIGTTPLNQPLPVTVGSHRLRLLNPYFEPLERTISVDGKRLITVTEVLRKTPSARPDR